MMEKLKPCPFCGGNNIRLEYWDVDEQITKTWEECDDDHDDGLLFPTVICSDCECEVVFKAFERGRDVIDAYNERSDNE